MPHLGKIFITEDNIDNTGTVNRRVRVEGTGKGLDTGHNNILLFRVSSHEGDATSTFTVDTEVLGEGLEQHDVVGVLGEESQGVSVLLEVTGGETLVGRVEGAEVVLRLDNVEDVSPLFGGGVNTSGVVSANVQENDRVVLGVLEIFSEAVEVETLGLGVVVAVLLPLLAGDIDKTLVKRPCGSGDQDINVLVGVPVREHLETDTEGAGTGDTLAGSNATFLDLLVVSTVSEGEALGDVGVNTLDAGVFVVHVEIQNSLFSLTDAIEDERLASVATVDTHAEELLLGVVILLEGLVKTKDRVSGGRGNSGPG